MRRCEEKGGHHKKYMCKNVVLIVVEAVVDIVLVCVGSSLPKPRSACFQPRKM